MYSANSAIRNMGTLNPNPSQRALVFIFENH